MQYTKTSKMKLKQVITYFKSKSLTQILGSFEKTQSDLAQFLTKKEIEIANTEESLKQAKADREKADNVLKNITALLS